ncbi:hypothetical protein [Arthrobacter sp. SLBN-122]|uniref:hypothetical protein n=1 Tax=Arthrobacter sp. SLBN-122 TaxID=2768455 RepID=UPI00114D9D0A|nr:hypothetical protein [Arthrobacter sp. SLBN-122]
MDVRLRLRQGPGAAPAGVQLADPIIQLLPWYAAVYLLIGACIFGPTGKVPPVRQAVAFLLPGTLLVPLALLNLGFWAGGWLLGLPAWGLLLSRCTRDNPLRPVQLLKFLGLLVLGLVIFTFNAITHSRAWACSCFPSSRWSDWPTPGTGSRQRRSFCWR